MNAAYIVAIAGFVLSVIGTLLLRSVNSLDRALDETKASTTRAHDRITANSDRLTVCETELGIRGSGAVPNFRRLTE